MISAAATLYPLILLLTACTLTRPGAATQWPTATTVRMNPATPVPTLDRDLRPVPSPQPSATRFAQDCQSATDEPSVQYSVVADVNYARHSVKVEQEIRYLNRADETLSQVVLNVEPNRWPDVFKLDRVNVDAMTSAYELTGQRLTVDLPGPLMPQCALKLELGFHLEAPAIGEGLAGYSGYLGYSPRQLNLGQWLPTIAVRTNGGWVIREANLIGEQNVLEIADWDVTLSVTEAARSLKVAAPGTVTQLSETTWRFVQPAARDFPVSMSEQFSVARQQTESGVVVELYSFDDALVHDDNGNVYDGAAYALTEATRALEMFGDLFGAYTYSRMLVVQGDFPDGREFTSLVFVSGDWFRRYGGAPTDYLMVITVHEIAHQWWYARVGNDAALHPWLDEALAAYSEYIFIEEHYPDLKDWWWQWRVERFAPVGDVDSSVYEFTSIREYINAVYLLGAKMLHDLRRDIGTEAFFDLLRRYAETEAGRIATPDQFWALLTPRERELSYSTRSRYLRQPDVGSD